MTQLISEYKETKSPATAGYTKYLIYTINKVGVTEARAYILCKIPQY